MHFRGDDTDNFPMLIGRPLAPRSPSPKILEPIRFIQARGDSHIKIRQPTICNDRDTSVVGSWPAAENMAYVPLMLNGNI